MLIGSTLYPPRSITRHQLFDLTDRHQVDIAGNRVLQARGSDTKIQGIFVTHVSTQTVEQPGSKGIAPAHPIYDVGDVIVATDEVFLAVVQASRPAVMAGTVALPEGERLIFQIGEGSEYLLGKPLVSLRVQLSTFHGLFPLRVVHLDTQRPLAVLLIGNAHVYMLDQFPHHVGSLFAILP